MIRIYRLFTVMYFIMFLCIIVGCSATTSNSVRSHMGGTLGAVTAGVTCYELLQANVALTAACAVVGSWFGSSAFYNDDINIHTAVFVDTLNTAPGKRSHTTWGNAATGNWGSITVNRSYLVHGLKCKSYESVISIEHGWPMNYVERENEFGTACQLPDGRWQITDTSKQ